MYYNKVSSINKPKNRYLFIDLILREKGTNFEKYMKKANTWMSSSSNVIIR